MTTNEAAEAAARAMALADGWTELDWQIAARRNTQRFYDLLEAAAPHIVQSAYEQGWEDGREGNRNHMPTRPKATP